MLLAHSGVADGIVVGLVFLAVLESSAVRMLDFGNRTRLVTLTPEQFFFGRSYADQLCPADQDARVFAVQHRRVPCWLCGTWSMKSAVAGFVVARTVAMVPLRRNRRSVHLSHMSTDRHIVCSPSRLRIRTEA